jgi:hypothetical protein
MKRSAVYLAVACAVLCAEEVQAVPVIFAFGGTVTQTSFDPDDPFNNTIQFGTLIGGIYVFESTTANAIPPPADASLGSYSVSGPPYGMTVNIGGNIFNTNELLNIGVANNIGPGVDQYTVLAQQGTPGGLSDFLTLELFLQDDQGTAFSSTALPLTPPDLSQFEVHQFRLDALQTIGGTVFQYEIQGSVNSLARIPEPGTVPLLGAGLVGLTLWYGRKLRDMPSLRVGFGLGRG